MKSKQLKDNPIDKRNPLRSLIERECRWHGKENVDGSIVDWVEARMNNNTMMRHLPEVRRVNDKLYIGTVPVVIDNAVGDGLVQIVEV